MKTQKKAGEFLTDLDTRKIFGERRLRSLLADLVYRDSKGRTHTAPTGTSTDLASIPRFFFRVFPPTDLYDHAAALHDSLYQQQVGRKLADWVFLDALKVCGETWGRRHTMYRLVRLCGGSRYKQKSDKG